MVRDTGSPRADAENDFLRARRHQVAVHARRLDAPRLPRRQRDAAPSARCVDALGRRGERSLGVQLIPLDADRRLGRQGRATSTAGSGPTSGRSRQRWERLASKSRTGDYLPPIDVYKLGHLYFVRDGHHRVSVARALGAHHDRGRRHRDRHRDRHRGHRRPPRPRREELGPAVPQAGAADRPSAARRSTAPTPHDYHRLAEMIEAWACRLMHDEGAYFDKADHGAALVRRGVRPACCAMIDEAGVRGAGETGADAYLRVARRALPADPRARVEQRGDGARSPRRDRAAAADAGAAVRA